jgi:hypothetical protein
MTCSHSSKSRRETAARTGSPRRCGHECADRRLVSVVHRVSMKSSFKGATTAPFITSHPDSFNDNDWIQRPSSFFFDICAWHLNSHHLESQLPHSTQHIESTSWSLPPAPSSPQPPWSIFTVNYLIGRVRRSWDELTREHDDVKWALNFLNKTSSDNKGPQAEQSGIFSVEILSISRHKYCWLLPHYNGIPSDKSLERIDA